MNGASKERYSVKRDGKSGMYLVKRYVPGVGENGAGVYLDLGLEFFTGLAALEYVFAAQGLYSYERRIPQAG